MKRTAGELGLAPASCRCDPMDLAALGHMENCPARRSTVATDDRTHGERVKAAILAEGLRLWPAVTARGIGKALGMTHGAVLYHFGTADGLRDAVAVAAVTAADARIIPQLIAAKHPAAAALNDADRQRYLAGC